jgi:hypothetical protein
MGCWALTTGAAGAGARTACISTDIDGSEFTCCILRLTDFASALRFLRRKRTTATTAPTTATAAAPVAPPAIGIISEEV